MAWALEEAGFRLTGFDGLIHSTIPFGSGLSSSAALEMAAGVAFQATSDLDLDPVRLAILGQRAENRFVGVNCGILDQYSSALGEAGSAVLLDCRDLCHTVAPIARRHRGRDLRHVRAAQPGGHGVRRAPRRSARRAQRSCARHYPHVTALRDATCEMLDTHRDELPAGGRAALPVHRRRERARARAGRCADRGRPAAAWRAASPTPTRARGTCTRSARRRWTR